METCWFSEPQYSGSGKLQSGLAWREGGRGQTLMVSNRKTRVDVCMPRVEVQIGLIYARKQHYLFC